MADDCGRFAGQSGGAVRYGAILRRLKAAGVPIVRLHDLRHTSASPALASGEHVKVVSERLGHSSTTMTMDVYSHVMPGMQSGAGRAIGVATRGGAVIPSVGTLRAAVALGLSLSACAPKAATVVPEDTTISVDSVTPSHPIAFASSPAMHLADTSNRTMQLLALVGANSVDLLFSGDTALRQEDGADVIVDGQVSSFSERRAKESGNEVGSPLTVLIPTKTFLRIASAHEITIRVAGGTYPLSLAHRRVLRAFAAKLDPY